jgi:hypothetical protein
MKQIKSIGARFGVLALVASAGMISAVSQDSSTREGVEETRAYLGQWVETERVLSAEKRDWELGRELLLDRSELVRHEIATLRGSMASAQESVVKADVKRAELMEANEQLKEASASLVEVVRGLESQLKVLLDRLPEPIIERVKPLSQRIPIDAEQEAKQSLGERFQNVVGVLNEINKFNAEISVTSEVRTLQDGSSAEVTAMYVGLGQAYYVTADGRSAGIGTSSERGWFWRPANEAALAIQDAIAIFQNEHVAEFVQLPVQIN